MRGERSSHANSVGSAALGRQPRGIGALSVKQQEEVIDMLRSGAGQKEIAELFGVSKNVIVGVWARHGEPQHRREPTSIGQRLDALHAQLDRVLAETRDVGRMPEPEREPGKGHARYAGPRR